MMRTTSLLSLVCAALLGTVACTVDSDEDEAIADSDTMATESGNSDNDSSDNADTSHDGVDLFACASSSPCERVSAHIDTEPHAGLVCAAELIAAGETAVLFGDEIPGPDQHTWENLVVLLGDGTALRQTRYREVASDPWKLGEQTLCKVAVDEGMVDACAEEPVGDACAWDMLVGGLTDCEPVQDSTCEDLASTLGG